MNQFRSKAFIKIKHTIIGAIHPQHLVICRQMIENGEPILTKDELTVLREYMLSAWDKINYVEDQILNEWHQKTCGIN